MNQGRIILPFYYVTRTKSSSHFLKEENNMKSENLVNAVMNEVAKLVLANHPDVPMFEKSMRRLAEEFYELIVR